MKQETIEKKVKTINRNVRFFQRRLTYWLEAKAEAKLHNGNLKVNGDYERNIKKYEIILADLATIKRAVKNDCMLVNIYGSVNGRFIYKETEEVLKEVGIGYQNVSGDVVFFEFNDEVGKSVEETEISVTNLSTIEEVPIGTPILKSSRKSSTSIPFLNSEEETEISVTNLSTIEEVSIGIPILKSSRKPSTSIPFLSSDRR